MEKMCDFQSFHILLTYIETFVEITYFSIHVLNIMMRIIFIIISLTIEIDEQFTEEEGDDEDYEPSFNMSIGYA